jgi:hypothetical protein
MANRVVRSVRPRTMRPDREPARSTNPNRFNFNSNNGTNAILVAIDFVDLKFDTGAFDSAENVDFIDLKKVTRGPIINPDDLWDPPFHRVADSIDLIKFSSDNGLTVLTLTSSKFLRTKTKRPPTWQLTSTPSTWTRRTIPLPRTTTQMALKRVPPRTWLICGPVTVVLMLATRK